jgi:hypothetical protein
MKTTIKFTMTLVLTVVAMISTALVVLPIQEVDAFLLRKGINADNTASNECAECAFCQAQAIQSIDPRGTSGKISADKTASNECSGPGTTCLAGAQQSIIPFPQTPP